jgi:hypothetical protein
VIRISNKTGGLLVLGKDESLQFFYNTREKGQLCYYCVITLGAGCLVTSEDFLVRRRRDEASLGLATETSCARQKAG